MDARSRSGARESNECPAEIGGRVRRLGYLANPGGNRAALAAAERDKRERFSERQQRARQTGDVPANSGRRRVERAAVDTYAKHGEFDARWVGAPGAQ